MSARDKLSGRLRWAISRQIRVFVVAGALAAVALPSGGAQAKKRQGEFDWAGLDQLPAVQNRKYRLQHEFFASGAVLPVDPFTKGYAVGGGYAWHLSDVWAVEGAGAFLFNATTSLRDQLEKNFGEPSSKFARFEYIVRGGVLFKPIYGKLSFANRRQVYGEVYLSLHAVVAHMTGGEETDDEPRGKGPRFAFGGAPGFGLRAFLSRYFSARLDFNWMVLASAGELHAPLSITLSLAVTTRAGHE